MAKRYVPNDGKGTIFVGGVMIPAGEGREVDESLLPPEAADDAAPQIEALLDGGEQLDEAARAHANLLDLLSKPLKVLVPLLAEFATPTLDELAHLEGEREAPRAGLLGAIQALKLQRAQDNADKPAAGAGDAESSQLSDAEQTGAEQQLPAADQPPADQPPADQA